jgi:hypothetical protein
MHARHLSWDRLFITPEHLRWPTFLAITIPPAAGEGLQLSYNQSSIVRQQAYPAVGSSCVDRRTGTNPRFPLVPALGSTASAAGDPALFGDFAATTGPAVVFTENTRAGQDVAHENMETRP